MKRKQRKLTILFGVLCVLLAGAASWYSAACNDSRFLVPMDLSGYVFRPQDLPMLVSGGLLALYILYLAALLLGAVIAGRRRERAARFTRKVSPGLGFLGLLGFAGFLGFWTYGMDGSVFPFVFFMFFGFFGFFYEGKMSDTLMDERYRENRAKARMAADRTALTIIFAAMLLLGQGRLMGNPEYTLIALIIVIALSLALDVFLAEYLLYRFDHDEQPEEGEG